jgi:hypothetical protein
MSGTFKKSFTTMNGYRVHSLREYLDIYYLHQIKRYGGKAEVPEWMFFPDTQIFTDDFTGSDEDVQNLCNERLGKEQANYNIDVRGGGTNVYMMRRVSKKMEGRRGLLDI